MLLERPPADKIVANFSDSVSTLLDSIIKECDWIDKNDPDPERTKSYKVDKLIRVWFGRSGNLGY